MPALRPAVDASALSAAADCLRDVPVVAAAFLHGSAARDELRADSDIDIALLPLPGTSLSWPCRLELMARLGECFGRTVDLGILTTRNVVYAKEVALHGRLLFSRNRLVSDGFLALALAMYADLQSRRRPVLDAYRA